MRDRYEAIVIGTGFGGAVCACRLAQAGLKVGVFERGRRYPLGGFPRDWKHINNGWRWQSGQGLFDVRPLSEMTIVQAAGYGGGSLVYANVHIRPPAVVFKSGWPPGYNLDTLAPYYDLVAYMLDLRQIDTPGRDLPAKTRLMAEAAHRLGRDAQFFHPNIAVDLSPPGTQHQNKFGATQQGCTYCGECVIGCNLQAKNTLDLNYLKIAQGCGADITTQCEVLKIKPCGTGYTVTFQDWANESQGSSYADHVFLCAGAVSSTELLLRCRDEHKTLPNLSGYLGHGYSGNSDFIAFAFNTEQNAAPSEGPTITTAVVYDRASNGDRVRFILQEGGYPPQIANLMQLLNPKGGWLKAVEHLWRFEELRQAFASAASQISASGGLGAALERPDHTAVFLSMGRDRANGIIELIPPVPELWVHWDVTSNLPFYDTEAQLSTDFAKALGGDVSFNPLWKFLHLPVSVHNLGGCTMAAEPGLGVTDPFGEVYGYPELYVLDGAIIPGSTGVNPSHTIAAVAERNVEAAIRKIKGAANWEAPERRQAQKIVDPISQVKVPEEGTAPPKTPPIQLSFTETLRGFVGNGIQPPDYTRGEEAGRVSGTSVTFTITITTPNLDEFLVDKRHIAIASGTLRATGFTGPDGAQVRKGIFKLFVTELDNNLYQRKMLYYLPFTGADGKKYELEGFKDIRDHGRFDVWGSTTTLYSVISERGGPVVATGILRVRLLDFLRQMTTMRITGTSNPAIKALKMARFMKLFLGTLYDVFVRPLMPGAR